VLQPRLHDRVRAAGHRVDRRRRRAVRIFIYVNDAIPCLHQVTNVRLFVGEAPFAQDLQQGVFEERPFDDLVGRQPLQRRSMATGEEVRQVRRIQRSRVLENEPAHGPIMGSADANRGPFLDNRTRIDRRPSGPAEGCPPEPHGFPTVTDTGTDPRAAER
jgi:hypothetical protein